jgi:imidazolonepropionase-like amidohydrolase
MDMEDSLTVLAGRIFDGTSFRDGPLRIDTRDGVITSVSEPAAAEPAKGAFLDASDSLVIPGIINAHVHIARGGMFAANDPISIRQVVRNFRTALEAGVPTVGEMGCSAPMARALRVHTRAHPEAGPQVVACGPLLTVEGGYPLDWMPRCTLRWGSHWRAGSRSRDARTSVAWSRPAWTT